ncbi:hypothetical protein [Hymenobacter sp. BT190]|uniref:hypothetical protein n=1 Tax=Hymenobacter sp. BT190 TaxID=2763505 RepID=UPI0016512736|nr:hypothetical protein [Hymenobacter sp. BT190]MBC6697782.1 hypothetical protein [Hymenobacter sp. BT190]
MGHFGVAEKLVAERRAVLERLSPYHFLQEVGAHDQLGVGRAARFGNQVHEQLFTSGKAQFLYELLPWDSQFFDTPTYRLFSVLFEQDEQLADLTNAVRDFQLKLASVAPSTYCFVEVPAEDIRLLQALTQAGWRWNETRLHYYHQTHLAGFAAPRHAVRLALPAEAVHLGQIAAAARNNYDRFHADPWFGADRADAFLARYAAAATEGYCDAVLVPDLPGLPVDSFMAISDLQTDAALLGVKLSRVVLTAVGPDNRGWHLRLLSETLHRARERGAAAVLMTTQATNRAVIRNAEKLNFALGATTHVLSCPSPIHA